MRNLGGRLYGDRDAEKKKKKKRERERKRKHSRAIDRRTGRERIDDYRILYRWWALSLARAWS